MPVITKELLDALMEHQKKVEDAQPTYSVHSEFTPIEVRPTAFVEERAKRWEAHGNVPSANLKYAWYQLCYKLNEHLRDAGKVRNDVLYQFPLETGGGKSTGLRLYFAMLGALAKKKINCPGALITAQRTADCDLFAEEVNRIGAEMGMEEPMAVAFHSDVKAKDKPKLADLKDWPFLVTTQRGLTIALIEENVDGLYYHRLPSLLQYGPQLNGKRDMIVMDEAMDPWIKHKVSGFILERVINGIPEELREKHDDICYGIEMLSGELLRHAARATGQLAEANLERWKKMAPSVVPLINSLRNQRGGEGFLTHFKLLEDLIGIYHLQKSKASFKPAQLSNVDSGADGETAGHQFHAFFKLDFILRRLNRGSFLLDATAQTSKLLDAYTPKETVTLRRCRDYSNLRIEIDRTTSTGRTTLGSKRDLPKAKATANRIAEHLSALDPQKWQKVGVIAFTDVIDVLKAKGGSWPVPIQFGNIGGVTGSNAFMDCDLLYIVGLNHRDPTYGDEVQEANKQHIEERKCLGPFNPDHISSEQEFEWAWTPLQIARYELVRDLIQTVGRGNNRKVVDDQGNCKPSTVRLTLDRNPELTKFLMDELAEAFPNAAMGSWEFIPGMLEKVHGEIVEKAKSEAAMMRKLKKQAVAKGSNNYERVLHWFKLSGMRTAGLAKIIKVLGLNRAYRTLCADAYKQQDGKYTSLMQELGIEFAMVRGEKGNPVSGLRLVG